MIEFTGTRQASLRHVMHSHRRQVAKAAAPPNERNAVKIIAKVDGTTALIEASHDEIANLHGYERAYSVPDRDKECIFRVGAAVPVARVHAAARSLHQYQAQQLQIAQNAVNSLQDTINRARDVFGPAE